MNERWTSRMFACMGVLGLPVLQAGFEFNQN